MAGISINLRKETYKPRDSPGPCGAGCERRMHRAKEMQVDSSVPLFYAVCDPLYELDSLYPLFSGSQVICGDNVRDY
jgi:hypothetical protein